MNKQRLVNRVRAAAAAGLVIAVVLALGGTAQAGAGSAASRQRSTAGADEWTARVVQSTTRISQLATHDDAFSGVAIDAPRHAVIIYRKGGGTTRLYSSVSVPAGTRVEYHAAPMTSVETTRVMDTVWRARAALKHQGIVVTAVTTPWNGHVTVQVQRVTPTTKAVIQSRFAVFGRGTVQVEQSDFLRPASRFNDTAPFFAGDRIYSATGTFKDGSQDYARCTSGFGGLSTNGKHYMLTAYHCAKPGDPRFWAAGNPPQSIGRASVLDAGHDLVYIPTSTYPKVWDGPLDPTADEFTKNVTAVAKPVVGTNHVYTSGSFSGARGGGTIHGSGHYTLCTPWSGQACYDAYLWYADKDDGTDFVAQGDSGGPVFIPDGNNVTAIGSISRIGNLLPSAECVGDGTVCSSTVYFSDVYTEAVVNHHLDLTR